EPVLFFRVSIFARIWVTNYHATATGSWVGNCRRLRADRWTGRCCWTTWRFISYHHLVSHLFAVTNLVTPDLYRMCPFGDRYCHRKRRLTASYSRHLPK